jgi:hypothetical protein
LVNYLFKSELSTCPVNYLVSTLKSIEIIHSHTAAMGFGGTVEMTADTLRARLTALRDEYRNHDPGYPGYAAELSYVLEAAFDDGLLHRANRAQQKATALGHVRLAKDLRDAMLPGEGDYIYNGVRYRTVEEMRAQRMMEDG